MAATPGTMEGKRQRAKGKRQKSEAVPPEAVPIEVLNRQRLLVVDGKALAALARAVLDRIENNAATLTLSFIRDWQMRQLNRDYRGIDKPTDVLSFAYHESADGFALDETDPHLGDVVISVETAQRYAAEQGLTFERELAWLVIHGTLHVAGYDHEADNGEMHRLEKKLRKQLLK